MKKVQSLNLRGHVRRVTPTHQEIRIHPLIFLFRLSEEVASKLLRDNLPVVLTGHVVR